MHISKKPICGDRYPQVNDAIFDALEVGAIVSIILVMVVRMAWHLSEFLIK